MLLKRVTVILLIFFYLPLTSAENFPPLHIYTEEWEPYHYLDTNSRVDGLVIDLMDRILIELNSSQDSGDIELLPWARAYKLTQLQRNALLFSTTRTEQREDLFKWVGPIFTNKMCLIAKKEHKISITNSEEIRQYRLGTVKDDVANIFLDELGITETIKTGTPNNNVLLLDRDRVDIITSSWTSFINITGKMGIDYNLYEPVYNLSSISLYFAFNIETDDWVIDQFSSVFNKIKPDFPELID